MRAQRLGSRLKENLSLNGVSEVYFWKSEWEGFDPEDRATRISIGFFLYRLVFGIYFILTLGASLVWAYNHDRLSLWPIYLTHWSYTVQTLYAILAFSLLLFPNCWRRGSVNLEKGLASYSYSPNLPLVEKLTWVLFNIVNTIPYGVTIIFWVAVSEGDTGEDAWTMVLNYVVHAINSVMALTDLLIVATPIRVTHFIFGLNLMILYILFTIIYEFAGGVYQDGGESIYAVLNWKNEPVLAAVLSPVALVVFALCHFIFGWCIAKIRHRLGNKFGNRNGLTTV